MVMPCSRSIPGRQAIERSRPRPLLCRVFWSRAERGQLVIEDEIVPYNNRPISVDFPSSTEPQVRNRKAGRVSTVPTGAEPLIRNSPRVSFSPSTLIRRDR